MGNSPTAGLIVEAVLLLGAAGELSLDPATGGLWPLGLVVALLLISHRYAPFRLLAILSCAGGIIWFHDALRQILLTIVEFLPFVWLSSAACLMYVGVALLTLLKGEALASLLPGLSDHHTSNFFFLVIVWIFLLLRTSWIDARHKWRAVTLSILVLVLMHIVMVIGHRDGALPEHLWANPLWRTIAAALVALPFGSIPKRASSSLPLRHTMTAMVGGMAAAMLLLVGFRTPVTRVIFDDSHGPWERTDVAYTSGEWGRDTVYNYRLLFEAQKQLGITAERVSKGEDLALSLRGARANTVLVLKTPMQEYSPITRQVIQDWIAQGGLAVAIADHTDLFGMTQRLNHLVSSAGVRFDATAVFDAAGGLTRPVTRGVDVLLGASQSLGQPLLFQTGTSLTVEGISGLSLFHYGLSYAEPADYTRPNHFGSLQPQIKIAYRNHAAEWFVPISFYGGGWLLVGDSTPWSNFSFAMPGYLQWWKGLMAVAEFRAAWTMVNWGTACLAVLLVLLAIWSSAAVQMLVLVTISMIITVGVATYRGALTVPDVSNVTWQQGNTAVVEFLKGMQPAGSLNYSHLFAALPRWHRIPRLSPIAKPPQDHREAFLLHPNGAQFDPDGWAEYVRAGGHLILVDDPWNAGLTESRRLLAALDIQLQLSTRSALRSLEMAPTAMAVWERVPEVHLEPLRPTAILRGRLSQWHRFEIGKGKLDVNLNGFGLSDLSIGDIWGGKIPGVYASDVHSELATILGGESPAALASLTLPFLSVPSQIEYSLAFADGKSETNVLESNCMVPPTSRSAAELLWCNTAEWLAGKQSGPWIMVAPGQWRTQYPVRLANGQEYMGQIVANAETWTLTEWVHDGMWGDDTTHRVIFRAVAK